MILLFYLFWLYSSDTINNTIISPSLIGKTQTHRQHYPEDDEVIKFLLVKLAQHFSTSAIFLILHNYLVP